jgi:hypothetical protein
MIAALVGAALHIAVAQQPIYALLVAGHVSQPGNQALEVDFRNDLLAQYSMLLKIGFIPDEIFVFYGSNGCAGLPEIAKNCEDATSINIKDVLRTIGVAVPSYLYMWWMSHGLPQSTGSDCRTGLMLEGATIDNYELVYGADLSQWLGNVNAKRIDFFLAACYGEGAIRFMGGSSNVVATADSHCGEESYDLLVVNSCDGQPHHEFNQWQRAAIISDTTCEAPKFPNFTKEGRLSLMSLEQYLQARMIYSTPLISDPFNIAPNAYLDSCGPGLVQQIPRDFYFPRVLTEPCAQFGDEAMPQP